MNKSASADAPYIPDLKDGVLRCNSITRELSDDSAILNNSELLKKCKIILFSF